MGFTEFYSLDGKENVNKCSTPDSGENSLSRNKTRPPGGVLTGRMWRWLPALVDWSPLRTAILVFSTIHTIHKVFNQYCKCRNHWMTGNGSLNWWLRETFLRHLQGVLTAPTQIPTEAHPAPSLVPCPLCCNSGRRLSVGICERRRQKVRCSGDRRGLRPSGQQSCSTGSFLCLHSSSPILCHLTLQESCLRWNGGKCTARQ